MADNKFYLYQRLPTTGAQDIRAFMHDGTQYLVVVNLEEGTSHNIACPPPPPFFLQMFFFYMRTPGIPNQKSQADADMQPI